MAFHRVSLVILGALAFGCSASSGRDDDTLADGSVGTDGGFDLDGGQDFDVNPDTPGACVGLHCQQVSCPSGGDTTVTGTVYAPNGTLPLYNVIVYVPNSPVDPLSKGASCDKCGSVASGSPVVTALSDPTGKFTLKNVPAGKNIPLVIQLGKWRRQVTIPEVTACTETALTDHELTRLPKKQSEGDMPRIAVTVGACDQLSCMLPKVGIDASEFGVWTDGDKKAVHFYEPKGGIISGTGPAGMQDARTLWSDVARLKYYDLSVFSCECDESPETKDTTSYKAVADYLAAGGRIFTTDFQYTWYKYSPDAGLKSIATIPGGAPDGSNPINLDTSFPKGKALADWLAFVDKANPYGKVTCDVVYNNVKSPADATKTQVWGASKGLGGGAGTTNNPRFMTINTPVGKPVEQQCGKAVHLDAHINNSDKVDETYPAGCKSAIKVGEEAFAFFFFDLSSCIQNEGDTPKPPPIK